jgi:hypothetical protein
LESLSKSEEEAEVAASESSFDDAAALDSERIVIGSAAIPLILDLTWCPVF